jgi:hypothetical protein
MHRILNLKGAERLGVEINQIPVRLREQVPWLDSACLSVGRRSKTPYPVILTAELPCLSHRSQRVLVKQYVPIVDGK